MVARYREDNRTDGKVMQIMPRNSEISRDSSFTPLDMARQTIGKSTFQFGGPFIRKSFLITVDAHSEWPEVIEMSSTLTTQTITALCYIFATHGIPEQLVSDNGPQFISYEFSAFCTNGVKHIQVSPYHLALNGMGEQMVQML